MKFLPLHIHIESRSINSHPHHLLPRIQIRPPNIEQKLLLMVRKQGLLDLSSLKNKRLMPLCISNRARKISSIVLLGKTLLSICKVLAVAFARLFSWMKPLTWVKAACELVKGLWWTSASRWPSSPN